MINIKNLTENKYFNIIFGIIIISITIIMFYYVSLSMGEYMNTHPEVTQIGAPLEFPIMNFIILTVIAFVFAILLALGGDGGINPYHKF